MCQNESSEEEKESVRCERASLIPKQHEHDVSKCFSSKLKKKARHTHISSKHENVAFTLCLCATTKKRKRKPKKKNWENETSNKTEDQNPEKFL